MPGVSISSLKVTELKVELEKRGIDKNGVKTVLVEKLRKVLVSEGLDPDDFSPADGHMNENDNSVSVGKDEDGDGDSQIATNDHADEEDLPNASTVIEERDNDKLALASSNFEKSTPAAPSNNAVTATDNASTDANNSTVNEATTQVGEGQKEDSVDQEKSAPSPDNEDSGDNLKRKRPIIKKSGKASENIIWVGNIGPNPSASDLKELFSQCGKVNVARIVTVTTRKTDTASTPVCYGYLEMMSAKDVELCIQEMDGIDYKDQTLAVATSLAGVKTKMLEIEEAAKLKKSRLLALQSGMGTSGRLSEKIRTSVNSPVKDELKKREMKVLTEERKLQQMRRQLELERKRFRQEKAVHKSKERKISTSVVEPNKKPIGRLRGRPRKKRLTSRLASAAAARLRVAKRQVNVTARKNEASRRERRIDRSTRVKRRVSPPRRLSEVRPARRSRSPLPSRVRPDRGTAKRPAPRSPPRVSSRDARRDIISRQDRRDSMGPPVSKYSRSGEARTGHPLLTRRSETSVSERRLSSKSSSRHPERPLSPRHSSYDRPNTSDRHARDVYLPTSRPYGLQIAERLTDALLAVSAARRERISLNLMDRSRELLGSRAANMISSSGRHNPVSVNQSEAYRSDYRQYMDPYSANRMSSDQARDGRIPHLSYRR